MIEVNHFNKFSENIRDNSNILSKFSFNYSKGTAQRCRAALCLLYLLGIRLVSKQQIPLGD